jgi:hypothetical protein
MPSTDTKPELTAKASMAQPVSQPAVYANWLRIYLEYLMFYIYVYIVLRESGRIRIWQDPPRYRK